jgi:nucleoside-diphosphate-sugar epimerase
MSLVIGAAGAIGKRLVQGLTSRGDSVIAGLLYTPLPDHLAIAVTASEMYMDVTDIAAIRRVFKKHPDIHTVWNLAAPLSVETANDPRAAERTVVGGMENVLQVMRESKVRNMIFTDSIGSFGGTSSRENCTARWLAENPTQDPGSDYGVQKRACRELMRDFTERDGGDTRFAVIPGVLHTDAMWGSGTTEYALEVLKATVEGKPYACPVDPDVKMPMIFSDDLIRGLMALQAAPRSDIQEPEGGYAMAGFSFSAAELFEEIERHGFDIQATYEPDSNMNKFAYLWPDALSPVEAKRDLGFSSKVGLTHTISRILRAHAARRKPGAAAPELSTLSTP